MNDLEKELVSRIQRAIAYRIAEYRERHGGRPLPADVALGIVLVASDEAAHASPGS